MMTEKQWSERQGDALVYFGQNNVSRDDSTRGTSTMTSHELFGRMRKAAIEMNRQSDSGALHIFVADGNCEDEHIDYCLDQPNVTDDERDFAQRMRDEFTEEQRFGVYAFAQCKDVITEAQAQVIGKTADVPEISFGQSNVIFKRSGPVDIETRMNELMGMALGHVAP